MTHKINKLKIVILSVFLTTTNIFSSSYTATKVFSIFSIDYKTVEKSEPKTELIFKATTYRDSTHESTQQNCQEIKYNKEELDYVGKIGSHKDAITKFFEVKRCTGTHNIEKLFEAIKKEYTEGKLVLLREHTQYLQTFYLIQPIVISDGQPFNLPNSEHDNRLQITTAEFNTLNINQIFKNLLSSLPSKKTIGFSLGLIGLIIITFYKFHK